MIVLTMDSAPENIRGELTKWLLEVKPGVFIGNTSSRVRDLLWKKVCNAHSVEGAVLAYSVNNEQGFAMRLAGTPKRKIVEFDGVQLVKVELFNEKT